MLCRERTGDGGAGGKGGPQTEQMHPCGPCRALKSQDDHITLQPAKLPGNSIKKPCSCVFKSISRTRKWALIESKEKYRSSLSTNERKEYQHEYVACFALGGERVEGGRERQIDGKN